MKSAYIVTIFLFWATITVIHGRIVSKSEFQQTMLQHGVPRSQLATWTCIVEYESHFDTAAYRSNGMHGMFQISQQYWCSPPGTGCGVSCNEMRSDNINKAVDCALKIYREHQRLSGNGFNAWEAYKLYCR